MNEYAPLLVGVLCAGIGGGIFVRGVVGVTTVISPFAIIAGEVALGLIFGLIVVAAALPRRWSPCTWRTSRSCRPREKR